MEGKDIEIENLNINSNRNIEKIEEEYSRILANLKNNVKKPLDSLKNILIAEIERLDEREREKP
jgi:hypothetical protein